MRINKIARQKGVTPIWAEGGSHSKVTLKGETIPVPRHTEVKELLARKILKDVKEILS